MTYLVINNPTSGRTIGKQTDKLKAALSTSRYIWIDISTNTSLENQILETGIDFEAIIISGGDGTINMCIQILKKMNYKAKLLIYPTGTTNEFAVHRKRTTDTCIKQIRGEMPTSLYDAGLVNGVSWFSYSLSFGTITKLSYLTPQKYKNKLGYLGYWLYGIVSKFWMRMKHYDLNVRIDNETFEGEFIFGSITNSYSLGNVLKFPSDEVKLNDGLFEIILIKRPKSIKEVTIILSDLITRNFLGSRFIIYRKSNKAYINSSSKISFNCDGELLGRMKNIVFEVQGNAIEC